MQISGRGCRAAAVWTVFCLVIAACRSLNLAGGEFFPFAAAGALLVLLMRSPKIGEIAFSLLLAILLAGAFRLSGEPFAGSLQTQFRQILTFTGAGSLCVLAWRAMRRPRGIPEFFTAAVLPLFAIVTAIALSIFGSRHADVYDLYLNRFDAGFGLSIMPAAAHWLPTAPIVYVLCVVAYHALPLAQVATITLHLRQTNRFPVFPVLVFGLAGLEGCVLYQILPAVGPLHVFGPDFASPLWSTSFSTVVPLHTSPPNSIPSLHLAWALLILWNIPRENRVAVWLGWIFLILMAIATLGLGEHYFVDLVVAVPFALGVQGTCKGRWTCALVSGVVTLGWLVYLRWFLPSFQPLPACVWMATAISVALPFFFKVQTAEPATETPIPSEDELVWVADLGR